MKDAFQSGEYFARFRANLDRGYKSEHVRTLRRSYRRAEDIIDLKKWSNPLDTETPAVLLLGSASSLTARTFVDFVHGRNSEATIYIADVSKYPLEEVARDDLLENPKVHTRQNDAANLQFGSNTINMIETDGLLQFIPPSQKAKVLTECSRVLTPRGVLTTRDWFIDQKASAYDMRNYDRRRYFVEDNLGATTYPAIKQDMQEMMRDAGFSTTMVRFEPYHERLKFFNHVVARKK